MRTLFLEAEDDNDPPNNHGKFFVVDLGPKHVLLVDLQTREGTVFDPTTSPAEIHHAFLGHPVHVCILYYPLLQVLAAEPRASSAIVVIPEEDAKSQPGLIGYHPIRKGVPAGRARNREVPTPSTLVGVCPEPKDVNPLRTELLWRFLTARSPMGDLERFFVFRFKSAQWAHESRVSGKSVLSAALVLNRKDGPFSSETTFVLSMSRGRGFFFNAASDKKRVCLDYLVHPMALGPLHLPFLLHLAARQGKFWKLPQTVLLTNEECATDPGPLVDAEGQPMHHCWEWMRRAPLTPTQRRPGAPVEEDGQDILFLSDYPDPVADQALHLHGTQPRKPVW